MKRENMSSDCTVDLRFRADHQKATQALNYFALKSGGTIDKLKAIKLIFFADRYHLRKYGRPVLGDQYFAMPHGPVASLAKDLAESSVFLGECEKDYVGRFLSRSDDSYILTSHADIDDDVFSDSDVEALEFAWKAFGRFDKYTLRDITHAYPEWNRHEDSVQGASSCRAQMQYLDFFDDPDPQHPGLQILHSDPFAAITSPEEKAIALERAEERTAVESAWD